MLIDNYSMTNVDFFYKNTKYLYTNYFYIIKTLTIELKYQKNIPKYNLMYLKLKIKIHWFNLS